MKQLYGYLQFASIVDQLKNSNHWRKSILKKRKQQKQKIKIKVEEDGELRNTSRMETQASFSDKDDAMKLEELKCSMLKKEHQDIQIEVRQLKNGIKGMEEQIKVFDAKENDVKQLKNVAQRELESILVQVRTTEANNLLLDQKHKKVIQQLQDQKNSLEHKNRVLAQEVNESKIRNKTDNMNFTVNGTFQFGMFLLDTLNKNQEISSQNDDIYSKSQLEQSLRNLYKILVLYSNWETKQKKKYQLCNEEANQNLHPNVHFWFITKNQIIDYYLEQYGLDSFDSLKKVICEFYNSMMDSIDRYESQNGLLNTRMIDLNKEKDQVDKIMKKIQGETEEDVAIFIDKLHTSSELVKANVTSKCRLVFQTIQREFRLADMLKRVKDTMNEIMQQKVEQSKVTNTSSSFQFSNNFLDSLIFKQKRTSKNKIESVNNLSSIDSLRPNKAGGLSKAVSLKSSKAIPSGRNSPKQKKSSFRSNDMLTDYQEILFRNPSQIIFHWYEIIKSGKDGANLLTTVMENDIYRIFFSPEDYDPMLSELENQTNCYVKSFEQANKVISNLKESLFETLSTVFQEYKKIKAKLKDYSLSGTETPRSETRYVIQSKGYFRRDNFKLLEKLETIQLKKRGLYIPFQYGVSVEQQMIKQRKTHMNRTDSMIKLREMSERKTRQTVPYTPNFISTYRQKLNKADRKIRNLLNNVDTLKLKTKAREQIMSKSLNKSQINHFD